MENKPFVNKIIKNISQLSDFIKMSIIGLRLADFDLNNESNNWICHHKKNRIPVIRHPQTVGEAVAVPAQTDGKTGAVPARTVMAFLSWFCRPTSQ